MFYVPFNCHGHMAQVLSIVTCGTQDSCVENAAIEQQKHNIPSVDALTSDSNAAQVFS